MFLPQEDCATANALSERGTTMKSGIPCWFDGAPSSSHPPLQEDMAVDVAIVGGGMVGLHLAWRLRGSGLRVALFQARQMGRQATGRPTAKVTSLRGMKYASLIRTFGPDHALVYAQANQQAVGTIADPARRLDVFAGLQEQPAHIDATRDEEGSQLESE